MVKPVLLSVDDDPAVSRAVARDLRRRFGPQAETRCRDELASFAPRDPRRHRVEDVRRALRWT